VIFLIKKKNDSNETPVPFKQYIKDIKDVFKNHKRWLIAVFIIVAILMFILFGFLFYLSSVLEDKFSIDGIKKCLLLAIALLALSIASYVTGKKIKNNLKVMNGITFIGIVMISNYV